MNRLIVALGFIASVLLLNSCLVSRKVVYLKDMKPDTLYKIMEENPFRIQKGDRLSIMVSAANPELVAPFNNNAGLYTVTETGGVSATTQNQVAVIQKGYLVDRAGQIDFPILGTLQVEGKTLDDLKKMVIARLKSEGLVNEPIVTVELLNMKIMMMGEVGGIGIVHVPEGKINLLEAINRSGGLTNNAKSREIVVIREEKGVRRMYLNDIESMDIFNSPTFHLQQNDIVYVKPDFAKQTPRAQMTWRYIGMGTGLITLFFTLRALTIGGN